MLSEIIMQRNTWTIGTVQKHLLEQADLWMLLYVQWQLTQLLLTTNTSIVATQSYVSAFWLFL